MLKRLLTLLLAVSLLLSLPLEAKAQTHQESPSEIFDSTELMLASPSSPELDAYLDSIMADIFIGLIPQSLLELENEFLVLEALGDLTTYEKMLACYDYVIDTVSYGSHMTNLSAPIGNTTCRAIYNAHGEVEGFGAVALSARTGMCNAYASAFILMARKIGLDAYLVKGSTRSGQGGYAYHEWAEINIDGQVYVFDPQLDQSLARQGLGSHIIFGKTYADIPGRYIK